MVGRILPPEERLATSERQPLDLRRQFPEDIRLELVKRSHLAHSSRWAPSWDQRIGWRTNSESRGHVSGLPTKSRSLPSTDTTARRLKSMARASMICCPPATKDTSPMNLPRSDHNRGWYLAMTLGFNHPKLALEEPEVK